MRPRGFEAETRPSTRSARGVVDFVFDAISGHVWSRHYSAPVGPLCPFTNIWLKRNIAKGKETGQHTTPIACVPAGFRILNLWLSPLHLIGFHLVNSRYDHVACVYHEVVYCMYDVCMHACMVLYAIDGPGIQCSSIGCCTCLHFHPLNCTWVTVAVMVV
jgi:hypothetical protein